MYRKSQAMSPSSETTVIVRRNGATEDEHFQSKFILRVTNLPLVNSGLSLTAIAYAKAKGINPVLGWTLDKAESTVKGATEVVRPVVDMFGQPLSAADLLACLGLDKVEQIVPSIQKTPEEIYEEIFQKIEASKAYGIQRGEAMLNTPPGMMALYSIKIGLDIAERYVDASFPPEQDEHPLAVQKATKGELQRIVGITSRIQRRAMALVLTRYSQAQLLLNQITHNNKTLEALQKQAESLVNVAKTSWASVNFSSLDHLYTTVINASQETTKQLQQALDKLQSLLLSSVPEPVKASFDSVIKRAGNVLEQAKSTANQLYATFLKHTKIDELTAEVVSILKDQSAKIQKFLLDFSELTRVWLQSSGLSILTPGNVKRITNGSNDQDKNENLNKVD